MLKKRRKPSILPLWSTLRSVSACLSQLDTRQRARWRLQWRNGEKKHILPINWAKHHPKSLIFGSSKLPLVEKGRQKLSKRRNLMGFPYENACLWSSVQISEISRFWPGWFPISKNDVKMYQFPLKTYVSLEMIDFLFKVIVSASEPMTVSPKGVPMVVSS